MKRKRTSIIWNITKEELQALLDESQTIKSVLERVGLNPINGNHRTLHERVRCDELSLEKLEANRKKWRNNHMKSLGSKAKISNNQVFVKDSKYNNNKNIKARLLKDNLIEYECSLCGNIGEHNGDPLSLQLDHLNGDSKDNRLVNLRFVCPNCHSQTKTYAGKRLKKPKDYETATEKEQRIIASRKFNPSIEELKSDLTKGNFCAIGRKYGVSDNAVRKRCKNYGLI